MRILRILKSITVVAAVVLITAGFGKRHIRVDYVDLVADGALLEGGSAAAAEQCLCGDETRLAVTLERETVLGSDVELGGSPTLELAGCVECDRGVALPAKTSLRCSVVHDGAVVKEVEIDLDRPHSWWSRVEELEELAGEEVRLILQAPRLPVGCRVRLRDACVRQQLPTEPPAPAVPQILLVSIDTLRDDALSTGLMPNLKALAAEGEVWAPHYAAATWTKPSHASMLSGYSPQTHQAMGLEDPIAPGVPMLAERVRSAGLTTGALVWDTLWVAPRWGFDRGFDEYRVVRWRVDRQVRAVSEWLNAHRSESFLFFFHTFEAHSDAQVLPYEAPGVTRAEVKRLYGLPGYGCRQEKCASKLLKALNAGRAKMLPEDPEVLRYLYDEGVRGVDAALGRLFDDLRESGLWDNLMVVVTSDHGEEFFEHGEFLHGQLYEEVIRVPLVVKWPGSARRGKRHSAPSSALDLAPTLAVHAGADTTGLPGAHLLRRSPEADVFSGTYALAIIRGQMKGQFGGGKELRRLFDLAADPGELHERSTEAPRLTTLLEEATRAQRRDDRKLLQQMEGGEAEVGATEISEAEAERLRALGYLD